MIGHLTVADSVQLLCDGYELSVDSSQSDQQPESQLAEHWASVGRWITGHHALVTTVCIAVLVVASVGLVHIRTSVQLLKLFDSKSQVITDYAWLEEHFGRLVPMELVVRFPASLNRPMESEGSPTTEQLRESRTQLTLIERADAVARIIIIG